jgi:hypothetical protein
MTTKSFAAVLPLEARRAILDRLFRERLLRPRPDLLPEHATAAAQLAQPQTAEPSPDDRDGA